MTPATYPIGSLVKARGREWVVLPESDDNLLRLRPLGGTDHESTGIYLPLEGHDVEPASFAWPNPEQAGDFLSCRLLRDAVRLGFRNSAGPFRSFGRMAVTPRPYQLVPLLMALKLDPVRLLIADDVGIGKSVEACLIARELIDRGEIRTLAVLCPPHLAEQWQRELADKFHIRAELVLSGTVNRLERNTAMGQSLFQHYPFVVVSTDFIKSSKYRDEFSNHCPEFVIVDEAHTCAHDADKGSGRHLRYQLLQRLAKNPDRHLVLVTATPHSGDEGAFRSLLGILRPEFDNLPEELTPEQRSDESKHLAAHLIQRRRGDIRAFLNADTPFPTREEAEHGYHLSEPYRKLFNRALDFAREQITVTDPAHPAQAKRTQRIRWWSALALLRSLASSPAAAAATLRTRSVTADAESEAAADDAGARAILDLDDVDSDATMDMAPGSQGGEDEPKPLRDRLLAMAREAEALSGPKQDAKLAMAIELVRKLLDDGFHPILFCRFIATADYVADALRAALADEYPDLEVAAITGNQPPAERESRVATLAQSPQRVLVATDCLSEGINLQEAFSAVVHYDLSWNPTRHEQREGRVDRYGQPSPKVRTFTCFGLDNQIDGIVLKVLLRKHKTIRSSLGISVPVPANTNTVVQALMNGIMLSPQPAGKQMAFDEIEENFDADLARLSQEWEIAWEDAAEREKRSRSRFAQHTIDTSNVEQEWQEMEEAIGNSINVSEFVADAVRFYKGEATPPSGTRADDKSSLRLRIPDRLREAIENGASALNSPQARTKGDQAQTLNVSFSLPVREGQTYLHRTHPVVEGLAAFVFSDALDADTLRANALKAEAPGAEAPDADASASSVGKSPARCGAFRTAQVRTRTTLLVLRMRHHIVTTLPNRPPSTLLAEECVTVAFEGSPDEPRWLSTDEAEALLLATPSGNLAPQQAADAVSKVTDERAALQTRLDNRAHERAQELLYAHQRVRTHGQARRRIEVNPQLPVDVLSIHVLLPEIR